jgi:hypothetical protein
MGPLQSLSDQPVTPPIGVGTPSRSTGNAHVGFLSKLGPKGTLIIIGDIRMVDVVIGVAAYERDPTRRQRRIWSISSIGLSISGAWTRHDRNRFNAGNALFLLCHKR